MKKLLAALTFLLAPVMAQADLINGGFETGNFTGWQTIGDALVVDLSIGTAPAGGTYQALITNAPSRPSSEGHFQSYSGTNSVSAFCSIVPGFINPLEAFLGSPNCSLTALATAINPFGTGSIAYEGSAIKQTFTGNTGEVLSFSWNFLTDEGGQPFDFAFVVLDGTLSLLADFSTLNSGSGTPFRDESGYHIFATTLPTTGVHYIGIGVVDSLIDPDINSGVLVDNFSVQKVPESASLFLMALGLIVMVRMGRRIA
jgi:hypothetical protein